MNVAFLIDPWDALDPQMDSTCRLIFEAVKRGHTVAYFNPQNLTLRDNSVQANCRVFNKDQKAGKSIPTFWKTAQCTSKRLPLDGFDVIFLRKNPPLDDNLLDILGAAGDDAFFINSVDGIIKASSKIYITSFQNSHEFIPETHVSKDKDYLMSVILESANEKMILKPLDGHAGQGVIVLEKSARQNISSLLDFYIDTPRGKRYVVLQEYLESASQGDVRVLILGGEVIGAMKRVPSGDDFRGNVHQGASVVKHSLTKREQQVCKWVGSKLVDDGIMFAGVDLIGEKLIEVNVRSPGGITRINKLNRAKLEERVLDYAEGLHSKKETILKRRQISRELVQNV